jgi:hypothetical protein
MKKSFSYILLFIFSLLGLHAALEKDLGQALAYFRVTDGRADISTAVAAIEHYPALVLDLRSVAVGDGLAPAIQSALSKAPALHAVRIVLINSTTAPELIAAINDSLLHVVTIGPRSPALAPDIAVATTDEDDHRAFTALANGTALEKLITDNHDKRRYDEAKLVQDHANGITPPNSVLPADAEDDSVATDLDAVKKPSASDKKDEPAPVTDLVLERAVQLHRSLLALKKL